MIPISAARLPEHARHALAPIGWLAVLAAVLALPACSPGETGDPAAEPAASFEALLAPVFAPDRPGGVVLVARDGETVYRRAFGLADMKTGAAMRPDHVFRIASITKEFTGAAILKLVADGRIGLDDDVRDHRPDFDTQGRRITIEQVLTHTGGLPNLVDHPDFETIAEHDLTLDSLLALTRGVPLHFEPGTAFRYSDTGYILLGSIIERVSGVSYGNYLEASFFGPLGMRDTFHDDGTRVHPRLATGYTLRDSTFVDPPHMSMTVPHAAGALASTSDDLLKWQRALRAGAVIRPDLLQRAWQARTFADASVSGYGFGFKNCTLAGHRTVEHGGFINGYLSHALMLPDENTDIIVLVNNDADAPDAGTVARRVARLLLTGSAQLDTVTLDAGQRAALTGTYLRGENAPLEIVEREGKLEARRGPFTDALVAISPAQLTFEDSEGAFVLEFQLDPTGRALNVRAFLRCEPSFSGTRG